MADRKQEFWSLGRNGTMRKDHAQNIHVACNQSALNERKLKWRPGNKDSGFKVRNGTMRKEHVQNIHGACNQSVLN
jgi:hypothetical protein